MKLILKIFSYSILATGIFLLAHEVWWSVKILGIGESIPILPEPFSSRLTFEEWALRNPSYWVIDVGITTVSSLLLILLSRGRPTSDSEDHLRELLSDLLSKCEYMSQSDRGIVKEAFDYAAENHDGDYRKSGEPFITHPVAAAMTMAELRRSCQAVSAALMHDLVEDTNVQIEDVNRKFGDTIAMLVDSVTNEE